MKKLSDTISGLAALRTSMALPEKDKHLETLRELEQFGSNPGALSAKFYVPEELSHKPALIVVLHGCTQTAAGYDHGSGWSQLAKENGFALLFPEQRRANNPNLCFNWFSPADNGRDRGEALSIRQMIETMVDRYGVDASRIFITGLSAGGAMTSIMLATYPEVFVGGAIIAGLPFGSASNVAEALDAMRGPGRFHAEDLGDRVRQASLHKGPWPTVSVWHGTSDSTVNATNADAILAQWLSVHGLNSEPDVEETVSGYPHRVWKSAAGHATVEDYRITGLGHGTPIATTGNHACGVTGPHMLQAGISSTWHIAATWGLIDQMVQESTVMVENATAEAQVGCLPTQKAVRLERLSSPENAHANPAKAGVHKVIEDALRAAGLMR